MRLTTLGSVRPGLIGTIFSASISKNVLINSCFETDGFLSKTMRIHSSVNVDADVNDILVA